MKAKGCLELIVKTCKDSPYEKEARQWLARPAEATEPSYHNCIACHTGYGAAHQRLTCPGLAYSGTIVTRVCSFSFLAARFSLSVLAAFFLTFFVWTSLLFAMALTLARRPGAQVTTLRPVPSSG